MLGFACGIGCVIWRDLSSWLGVLCTGDVSGCIAFVLRWDCNDCVLSFALVFSVWMGYWFWAD